MGAIISLDSADRKRAKTKSEMAAQDLDLFATIEGHCLARMEISHKRALVLECQGKTHEEIAAAENVSPATVGQWLRIASSEIGLCLPAGTKVSKTVRGYWVGRHVDDCLADAVDQLRGAVSMMQPGSATTYKENVIENRSQNVTVSGLATGLRRAHSTLACRNRRDCSPGRRQRRQANRRKES